MDKICVVRRLVFIVLFFLIVIVVIGIFLGICIIESNEFILFNVFDLIGILIIGKVVFVVIIFGKCVVFLVLVIIIFKLCFCVCFVY